MTKLVILVCWRWNWQKSTQVIPQKVPNAEWNVFLLKSKSRIFGLCQTQWSLPADVVWCCTDLSIFSFPDISHRSNKQEWKHLHTGMFSPYLYIYCMGEKGWQVYEGERGREREIKWVHILRQTHFTLLHVCVCVCNGSSLTVCTYSNNTSYVYEFPPWSMTINRLSLSLFLFLSLSHIQILFTWSAGTHVTFSVLHNLPVCCSKQELTSSFPWNLRMQKLFLPIHFYKHTRAQTQARTMETKMEQTVCKL